MRTEEVPVFREECGRTTPHGSCCHTKPERQQLAIQPGPGWGKKENQMATKVTVNRSAVTGKFVTPQYAAKHPRTTEKENYKKK